MEASQYRLCISNSDVMKKFFSKLLFAAALFLCVLLAFYAVGRAIMAERSSKEKGSVFVWGDSQMYQGLDVALLQKVSGKRVLTSAHHGGGIYDFVVSATNVPGNCVFVSSYSEAAFFRNPTSDYNRAGMDLSALHTLRKAGCPMPCCAEIIMDNRRSLVYSHVFSEQPHVLCPWSDTLECSNESLDLWPPLFVEEKEWFPWKASAYEKGLQNLREKGVRMVLVQFPFETQLEAIAEGSINRHLSDSLKWTLIKEFDMRCDTVVLRSDSLLMHDLSHMNEVGARMFTAELANILRNDSVNNRFVKVMIE